MSFGTCSWAVLIMINVMATWFKILRVVRANKTAQGNMTLLDTAELMKDQVHKSVSRQRTCLHLVPSTDALDRGRNRMSFVVTWQKVSWCLQLLFLQLCFILSWKSSFSLLLPLSFHQYISLFTEQWKDTGATGTEAMANHDGKVRKSHAVFLIYPNHGTNSPW